MSLNPISKYLLDSSTNKFTKIRRHARYKCDKIGLLKKCQRCDYDKHVEVCHIKSISSFDENTDIDVVNDLSNIIVLCPNHHWEFDNQNFKSKRKCPKCGNFKNTGSKTCKKCCDRSKNRKVERPSLEELQKLLEEMPMTKIGIKYGVSSTSIKKWCKFYKISTSKKKGFWISSKNKLVGPAGIEPA